MFGLVRTPSRVSMKVGSNGITSELAVSKVTCPSVVVRHCALLSQTSHISVRRMLVLPSTRSISDLGQPQHQNQTGPSGLDRALALSGSRLSQGDKRQNQLSS